MNPVEFLVLVALAEGDLHGYGLVRDIEARTEGRVTLRPGNLYRVLDRLLERGLLEKADRKPVGASDHQQRQYYRITPEGHRQATEEAKWLSRVVGAARGLGAITEPA